MKKRSRSANNGAALAIASAINTAMKKDVVRMATDPKFRVERIPTGSLTMDRITGGGFARGRHIEIFGDYSAGKSYITYRTMVLAQERGELCAIVDAEKVFDEDWYRKMGGDPDKLLYFRPNTAEELIEVLMLFAQGAPEIQDVAIVGIDSVATLLPQEELAKAPTDGEDRTASRARMMSRLLRRVTTVNDNTLFIWTNQLIDKVGGYGGTTTPGGRALKFYASARIEMRKMDRVKKPRKVASKGKIITKDVPVGYWVAIRAEKQKTARPEAESMFFFDLDRACIDREAEMIHLGLEDGIITRSGNTFSYVDADGVVWSGLETKFKKIIRENDALSDEIEFVLTENTREKMFTEATDDDGDTDG